MLIRSIHPWAMGLIGLAMGFGVQAVSQADELPRSAAFGAQLGPVTADLAAEQKLGSNEGVHVVKVVAESAAEKGGLKADDVILRVGDKATPNVQAFLATMRRAKAGEVLALEIVRAGKPMPLAITLGSKPKESSDAYSVTYGEVATKAGRLRTIVTRPKGDGPFPAFYIIQGLGGFTIENPPAGPGVYQPFVEKFARSGFVTIRVDKPGQGDSEGGPTQDVDFETELDGYIQTLKMASKLDFVDPKRIVIFGHSMGGIMGPLAAKEVPVKGIAVFGTGSKTWNEYLLENVRRQMALEGAPASEIDEALRQDAAIYHMVDFGGKSPAEVASAHPELADRIAALYDDGKYYSGRHFVFFRQLSKRNLAEAWEKFGGHALAVWGEADFVSSKAEHQLIAEIVEKSGKGRGRFVSLERTDHGIHFAESQADARARFGQPGAEFNPAFLELLYSWAVEITGEGSKP
ncbi:MAG: alpha/beta fold hydrolase [Isosphaeraceae bacterium]|nr:alpha/beta fold hydrolase [Isosphaeraceae bacterium]